MVVTSLYGMSLQFHSSKPTLNRFWMQWMHKLKEPYRLGNWHTLLGCSEIASSRKSTVLQQYYGIWQRFKRLL